MAEELFKKGFEALNKEREELAAQRDRIVQENALLSGFREKIAKMSTQSRKIKLDVGGKIFCTSIATLSKETSMLSAMFSGQFPLEPGEDGSFFIDRNPKCFGLVLDHLRNGGTEFSLLSQEKIEGLRVEADFYQIPSLIQHFTVENEKIQWKPTPNVQIDGPKVTALSTRAACVAVQSMKPLPKNKPVEWTIRVNVSGRHLSIGVVQDPYSGSGYLGNSTDGWCLNEDGRTENSGKYQGDARALIVGEQIKVKVHQSEGTIEWSSSQGEVGAGFSNLPIDKDLYPAVMVYAATSVSFVR